MNILDLQKYGLIYLATPYTKYPNGHDAASDVAASITAVLLEIGLRNVFATIPYGHNIEKGGTFKRNDLSIWVPLNAAFIKKCDALVVAMMASWAESVGIYEEIKLFTTQGKPIFYLDVDHFTIAGSPL